MTSFIKRIYPEASDECARVYVSNPRLFDEIFRIGENAQILRFQRTGRTTPRLKKISAR